MKRHYYQLFAPTRYREYAKARFAYVKFETVPTSDDTSDIIKEAEAIIEDYQSGLDFAELAKQYSQDTGTKDKGGDLDWFDREAMVPEFSEAAFSTKPGELVGPIQSKYGFHIILVEDKRVEDGTEQVRARHILLKIKPSADTREQIYTEAYNFAQDAKNKGFTLMAQDYGYEIDTTKAFSEAGYIQDLGRMRMAAQFCFNNEVGTVSDVYPVPEGYVVFQISEVTEEGLKPYEDVASSIQKRLSSILPKHKVWDKAAELRAEIETPDDFESVAARNGLRVYITDDSLKVDDKLPDDLKRDKDFLIQAFRLEEGEISGVIQTKRGCYIAYMEKKSPLDEQDYLSKHPVIYQKLFAKKQEQALNNWIRELRITANIRDYRYRFFRDF